MASGLMQGKVVVITGGGSGIGRAAAGIFADEGARVVVADVRGDLADETADLVTKSGGEAVSQVVDVTDETAVGRLIATTVESFGRLDAAFNNAGISDPMVPFHQTDLAAWHRMIDTNLTSVFLCMKHEIAYMVDHGGGAIVNTSSGAGIVPAPGQPHYTAAKHGVIGLTKAAAQEYAKSSIRVNAVCPGVVDTPMMRGFIGGDEKMEQMMVGLTTIGRMARPDEIARAAVWLASDQASYISGESLIIDAGQLCR
jgi:NAD(P)-dependent dehydrogenase (short-subunit alcohol dehydrogenase family)